MEPYERTASLPPTAPEKIESPKEEPVEQPREEAREEPKREEPKREELRKEDPGKEDQRKPKPVPDKHGKPVTASKPKETAPPAGPRGRKSPQPVDLRPNAAEIARGSFGGGADFLQGEADEIVLDINTKEDRFSSYLVHLKQKIQGVWIYPSGAAKAGLGGGLTVEFSIDKSGELLYVNLLDSSGHTILDESAVKAIRTAAPYNPFPARMKAKKLRIRANFIYVTQNFFRNIM
jgi:protein TonB